MLKKKGLLQATEKSGMYHAITIHFICIKLVFFLIGGVAGEGYGYLKSPMWWSGMILSKVVVVIFYYLFLQLTIFLISGGGRSL